MMCNVLDSIVGGILRQTEDAASELKWCIFKFSVVF